MVLALSTVQAVYQSCMITILGYEIHMKFDTNGINTAFPWWIHVLAFFAHIALIFNCSCKIFFYSRYLRNFKEALYSVVTCKRYWFNISFKFTFMNWSDFWQIFIFSVCHQNKLVHCMRSLINFALDLMQMHMSPSNL